jgi:hypothetical protein
MSILAASLNLSAALTGTTAAFFWFKASREKSLLESLTMITRPEDLMDLYWKLREVHRDAAMAAKLNRIAALWTAASVLLAGAASLASSFSN